MFHFMKVKLLSKCFSKLQVHQILFPFSSRSFQFIGLADTTKEVLYSKNICSLIVQASYLITLPEGTTVSQANYVSICGGGGDSVQA